jgi:hypothetical protein
MAFVGRQFRIEVGGDEFFVVLLFFHVTQLPGQSGSSCAPRATTPRSTTRSRVPPLPSQSRSTRV